MQKGNIGVTTENIFPIIKKFLYSDHEIFLRELVSNAVDATQKLNTLASIGEFKGELGDLTVHVELGKDTITISDRGIGLTAEEIEKYINQIAFSGANDFLEKYKKVLKLGGQIHFKTDNANLFAWSLPEMESCFLELRNVTDDLHANGPVGIMTGYEEKFYALGTPIHRVEAVVVTKQPRPADAKEPEEAEAGEDA